MAFSFADTYNKERLFDVDTEGLEYISLDQLFAENGENRVYPIRAMYINRKGLYEDAPVYVTDDCMMNIPAHMTDTTEAILSDVEAIQAIRDGKVGVKIYHYFQKKYQRECFNVSFVDIA